jgi:phospholipase/carboxylesterase
VPCECIFVAGFSQGGAIAYSTALTHAERLGRGHRAVDLPADAGTGGEAEATAVNAGLPIFAAHGNGGRRGRACTGHPRAGIWCKACGHPVEWREYAMPHSVCIEEIIDIGAWLRARMAAIEGGSP